MDQKTPAGTGARTLKAASADAIRHEVIPEREPSFESGSYVGDSALTSGPYPAD
jgi:hypothetical protein